MKKIEVLYSEVCNLFGDIFNIKYLGRFDDIEIIYTSLNEKPRFVDEKIDMIYISPMTEHTQELVIEKLKPYKKKILELVEKKVIFFLSGNALEIFGKYIENEDGSKVEGLGITSLHAKRDMMHRYNSLFLGKFNDIKIVGFKSSFSQSFGIEEPLFKVIKGIGLNKESNVEGFRIKNVFGTYVLGPILVFNPFFAKYILDLLGVKYKKLELEEELMDCYKDRLEEFENNFTKFD